MVVDAIKESGFEITELVSGAAPGVDQLGEKYARKVGIRIREFPADWKKHGKAGGPIRNEEMAQYADALIAIRYNFSRGTTDMINRAKSHGLKVFVKELP